MSREKIEQRFQYILNIMSDPMNTSVKHPHQRLNTSNTPYFSRPVSKFPTTPLETPSPLTISNTTPTLIDWLYLSDFSIRDQTQTYSPDQVVDVPGNEKQGALIVFPRMVDRWNVASLIVSKWEGYKVFIVTDHPNEFMHTISHSIVTEWTDLELVQFPLVKYSDIADINRILHNTEIDIVLFDDARMLATISSGLDFTSIQPKIIVLTSWGDTYKQLDVVTSKLPDLRLLTLDLISDTADIRWNVVKVPMSSHQLKFYDQIRKKELENASINKISYPMTRMVTLYSYPDVIMADTLQHKSICETDQSSIPDRLDSSVTWLNSDFLKTLETQGPKLESLIDGIVSNWPNKQIISTRFNHRYGVDLIVSFLQLLTQNKKNPYELNEIFHVSCTDNYDATINEHHKFNDAESGILVSNIVPLIPLKGVSIVHVADSYSFLTLKMIIDRCHKRYLNKGSMDFTIYSHVATHPTDVSSDVALYDILSKDVQEANRIYSGLISSSGHIVFKPGPGLLVI